MHLASCCQAIHFLLLFGDEKGSGEWPMANSFVLELLKLSIVNWPVINVN